MPVVTGWVLAEDAALKEYLSGYTVTDATSGSTGRVVQVWYRNPEPEERPRTYPYISIDLIDVNESDEGGRHMVNRLKIDGMEYMPPDPIPASAVGTTRLADRPLPINLDYQVSAYSRMAMHDRRLLAYMLRKFPGKWGALHVPGDETARTMQNLGSTSSSDTDENGKRLYRRTVRVRIFSEMWPAEIEQITNLTAVDFTIIEGNTNDLGIDLHCHE